MSPLAEYTIDETPLRATALARCHRADKDGRAYFVKLYSYRSEDDVTAQQHMRLQERIRRVLDGMGNVSEKLVEHGLLEAAHIKDAELRDDGYYQVKPWVGSEPGGEVIDLARHMPIEDERVVQLQNDDGQARELQALVAARVMLAKAVSSLVRRCHEQGLVHQDLKPEQFLIVSLEGGGVRPIIADFDWSFFEGEEPLKVIGTQFYFSPEHLTEGLRPERASDVFTLALIVFEILTGGYYLLTTREEMNEGLSPKEVKDVVRRGEARRKLTEIYDDRLGGGRLNYALLEELDDLLARSVLPDATRRPSAMDIESLLSEAVATPLFRAEGGPRPASVPAWLRLRAVEVPEQALTISAEGGLRRMWLDRSTVKAVFTELADSDGNPFHRYFPAADERDVLVPLVEFSRDPSDGWSARGVAGTQNSVRLRRKAGGEIELGSEWTSISVGDRLVVVSTKRGMALENCALELTAE